MTTRFLLTVVLVLATSGRARAQAPDQWSTATIQPESYVKGERAHLVIVLATTQGKQTTRELDLPVGEASAAQITEKLRGENKVETAKTDVVKVGTVLNLLWVDQPTPSAPLTPREIWRAKRDLYRRLRADIDAGITAEVPDAETLLGDLLKTYQSSYVDVP